MLRRLEPRHPQIPQNLLQRKRVVMGTALCYNLLVSNSELAFIRFFCSITFTITMKRAVWRWLLTANEDTRHGGNNYSRHGYP